MPRSSAALLLQAVASLAWAYSTLQYDHPQLYDSLATAALRMLRSDACSPGDAAPAPSGGDGSARGGSGGEGSAAAGCSRADFTAQAVSVLAFSFASANRCDSPAQRQASVGGGLGVLRLSNLAAPAERKRRPAAPAPDMSTLACTPPNPRCLESWRGGRTKC